MLSKLVLEFYQRQGFPDSRQVGRSRRENIPDVLLESLVKFLMTIGAVMVAIGNYINQQLKLKAG